MARRTVSGDDENSTLSENGSEPPWSGGEEDSRVRSGFPPWRSMDGDAPGPGSQTITVDESGEPSAPIEPDRSCECWTRRPAAAPGVVERLWAEDICPVHTDNPPAGEQTWTETECSAGAMTLGEAESVADYVREHAPPDPDDASIVARNSATVILLRDALDQVRNERDDALAALDAQRGTTPAREDVPEWERVLRAWPATGPETSKLRDAIDGMLGELDQLRTELAESGEALTAVETAQDVPAGSPIAANRPEWYVALDDYAGGGKGGGVKVLRPAARSALDELERCWVALSHSTPNRDLAGAQPGKPNVEQVESDHDTRVTLLDEYADELRTRFPNGPTGAWSAGWLSAAGWLEVAEADIAGVGPDTDVQWSDEEDTAPDDDEPVTEQYNAGWSDAIEDGIGENVWAGAPMRWRFVQPGDVVLAGANDDDPAGVPWMVRSTGEGARSFDLDVHIMAGNERDRATVGPDTMVTVLLPAEQRAAIVALRKGLGARMAEQ